MKVVGLKVIDAGEPGPVKPPFGEPCNGCGVCCASEVCRAGVQTFETNVAPCPGLIRYPGDAGYSCALVAVADLISERHGRTFRAMLAIGRGCDAQVRNETRKRAEANR